jgi:hypothetical protein
MATDQELWQYATLRRGVNSQQDIFENIPSPYRCRICGSAEVKTRFLAREMMFGFREILNLGGAGREYLFLN